MSRPKPPHNTCTLCGQTKEIARFHKHKIMAAGYYNQCKLCMAADQARRSRRIQGFEPNPISELLQKWKRL